MARLPRLTGLTALAIFLVWEVGSRSVVAYLANSAPETVAHLRFQEPTALLNLAERALNQPIAPPGTWAKQADGPGGAAPARLDHYGSPGFDRRIRTWVESVLLIDPLNAKALRILGQLAGEGNDKQSASKFMQASARISLHETLAVYYVLHDSMGKKDYTTALRHADVLLRTRPSLMGYIAPALAKMVEEREARDATIALLSDHPPWRAQFFLALVESISDARIPLDLLLSLRDSPFPPSLGELKPYIAFLVRHKAYGLAYYTWLQFLPPDKLAAVELLFNGSFEFAPSGLPFDWTIGDGSGVSIDLVPRDGKPDGHALFIEFEHGRVNYRGVTQMTMLSPGNYVFRGKFKGNLAGRRGLKWRISCAGQEGHEIGASDMIIGVIPSWSDVKFRFSVPENDCLAQQVNLDFEARSASERFIVGSVWFDELQIARFDDAASR
jgi:hypothetical protein